MDITQTIILAILQGLTEFLPISSSAHLILIPIIANWEDQGLAFDVAVHVGTLVAVIIYFRKTLLTITQDWVLSVQQRKTVGDSRLAWAVLFGTIPVGLAGLTFNSVIAEHLRDPLVIAITTLVFGALLGWADWRGKRVRDEHQLNWKDILFISIAQAIALIPGTSRSGITITAGLMLGLTRQAAARFSFLLSIPVIFLAGGLETFELIQASVSVNWNHMFWGALIAGISAYACIAVFLRLLQTIGMWPFVVYRMLLGIILLVVIV